MAATRKRGAGRAHGAFLRWRVDAQLPVKRGQSLGRADVDPCAPMVPPDHFAARNRGPQQWREREARRIFTRAPQIADGCLPVAQDVGPVHADARERQRARGPGRIRPRQECTTCINTEITLRVLRRVVHQHQLRGAAELVLVDNPPQHPQGDFGVDASGALLPRADAPGATRALTFAGIGVYRPDILRNWQATVGNLRGAGENPPRFPLAPLLRAAIARGEVVWRHHRGTWVDVGTPERLAALDRQLRVHTPS
jgi:hypothetical protein